MAIIYFSYIFEASAFYQTMAPLVSELERENYQPLYSLAQQIMKARPESWSILDNLCLGSSFDDYDEELSPRILLTMIQAQFLQPIAEFGPNGGWTFLKNALPLIGWNDEQVKLLLSGRSLCTLLTPDKVYNLKGYGDCPQDLPWCEGYTGWLDLVTITQLSHQLTQSREAYVALSEQPQAIREKIYSKNDMPLEWYSKGLLKDYADMMQILITAQDAQRALAMAVA